MAKKKRIEIKWEPQPRQLTFLRACGLAHPFEGGEPHKPVARVIGYGGAAGGGKSDSLLAAGIIAGLSYPGINIGYFRREYPQLEGPGGAIMRSQELMSSWAKWNGGQRRWTLPTKAVLQFCHCKDESDVYSYQSQQFDVLLFDEGTQFIRFIIRYMLTRNRATKPNVVPFAAIGTNPGGVGHGWFMAEFVEAGPPEQVHSVEVEPGRMETHIFIPAKLSDNEILEKRDPGYRATLEAQPETVRRQLLDGDWNAFAGQYFKDFRRDKHVIEPFQIPAHWPRFGSMDWGYNDPTAFYWHAIDPDGRIYTYRELYISQVLASELAGMVLDLTGGEDLRYIAASPDMWQKRGNDYQRGESIAETFASSGVYLTRADPARIAGWTRMREYLATAPDGVPWWQIFSTCEHLIRTLPALVHDAHRVEDVSDKCEDHGPESCRYFLFSRPSPLDGVSFLAGDSRGHRGKRDFDLDEDDDDESDQTEHGFYSR